MFYILDFNQLMDTVKPNSITLFFGDFYQTIAYICFKIFPKYDNCHFLGLSVYLFSQFLNLKDFFSPIISFFIYYVIIHWISLKYFEFLTYFIIVDISFKIFIYFLHFSTSFSTNSLNTNSLVKLTLVRFFSNVTVYSRFSLT